MDNVDQQSVEQDPSATALRARLGELLSRERLSQQKDVNDVARRLMLSKLQLLAIETGASESFHHERRYIQGIKSYVFYLGLQSRTDVTELVTQIEGWSAEALKASPAARVADLHRTAASPVAAKSYARRGPRFLFLGLGLLVAGAIVLAIYEGWPFKDDTQEVVSTDGIQPVTTSVVTPMSSPKVLSAASGSSSNPGGSTTATIAGVAAGAGAASQAGIDSKTTTSTLSPPSAPAIAPAATPAAVQNQAEATQPSSDKKPVAMQDGKNLMRIDFSGECWVSLQTAEGKKEERIYKAGESLSVPFASVTSMVLGNAPAAKIFLAGRSVDVLSKGLTNGNVTRLDQKGIQTLLKN